jgi:hypothetical protein
VRRSVGRDPTKYVVDTKRVPSVTEILTFSGWNRKYNDVDPATLANAAARGTIAHDLTEQYDDGLVRASDVDERYQGYLRAWERFCEQHRPSIIHSERVVISKRHRFGGTLDRFLVPTQGPLAGRNILMDIKTPAEPGEENWGLQTAGYMIAFVEQYGDYEVERYTIRLGLTGAYELDRWPREDDVEQFIWAANTVNAQLDAGLITLPEHRAAA